ncbi:hypothetical protein BC939DRAFT_238552 [Gamsiella multidivaricata]|uniref:uncharacterized protein n=1 Tax=Gamsiella multidivaricata TaxID=101098 RepID=UPI00222008D3|nr:uncharacterized protein BC939DRAFT_238552 [Gamsiella multidivaricata]KAI7820322.1 hypothetical protein BC939DRAFT_238552 [Gamsiella multidivaricata]
MTALDLGGSVPQRISGMLQTTFPKMITQVENYLQLQAAPPIVRIPEQTIVGQPIGKTLSSVDFLWIPSIQLVLCSAWHLTVFPLISDVDALSIDDNRQEKPLVLPSIIPWNQPTNRILTREFRLKDSYFEILVLFDQFRLYPSRLDLATERRSRKAKKPHEKLRSDRGRVMDVDQGGQETAEMTTLDATEEKTKNRTVLELVVDLKQYPVGYNIITSIKVDPEFLLQHKQQRDMGLKQQQQMANLTPNLKLAGSTSAASLTTGVASAGSRFIGGFDEGGSAIDNNNQVSYDGDIGYSGWSKTPTSEAASSGTGIAAVLGSSANVPRALPSSTSLIRILPPPITVNVIDIPPAPSHSSSLSGISRRRKHLIIITVPEAEVSVTHANAQYQAAAAAASLASKGFAPHIISGTTAKPVVTTGSVSGTTSTMFSAEDRVDSKQSRHQASSNSSHDADSAIEAIRPALSPNNTPVPPEAAKPTHQSAQAGQDLETRMFQFGVKIDRLEHKSLDHSALQVTKDSLDTAADEKEWDGKVMVDGIPAKVITGWSRQELGFLDGMMEDDGETSGQQRERGQSFAKESSQRNDAYSDRRREAPSSEEEDDEPQSGNQEDGEGLGPKTTTRRKKHRRQQLANVNENQESGLANVSHRSSTGITSDEGTNRTDTTGSNTRPTSSMYGLSNFLMSVGLLGDSSTRGSKADHDPTTGAPSDDYSHSSVEYDDLDDDRTIRASKSVIRSRLSGILSNNEGKSRRGGGERERRDDDHDLDLESLHGSIVFEDYGEYSDDGYNNNGGPHGSVHHGEGKDKEISDWARHSSSVRRRKGKEVVSSDHHREHEQSSLNMLREGDRGRDHSLELDSETTSSNVNRHHYRRRGSRSSMHQNGRSGQTVVRRHGSTNGADHPRFRGSKLYSYSFRNLFWSAVACFLVGLLLRIYVIGPSFLKAVSSTSGSSASSATYYYYYHAPKQSAVSSSSSRTLLPTDGAGSRGNQHARAREDVMDNTVWPHGIREVFTVRRLLGWDFVLLAYPTQDEQR